MRTAQFRLSVDATVSVIPSTREGERHMARVLFTDHEAKISQAYSVRRETAEAFAMSLMEVAAEVRARGLDTVSA